MPAIVPLALAVIVALIVFSLVVHILFSPWLLLAVAILIVVKYRPRRSRQ